VSFAELDAAIAEDPQASVAALGASLGCGVQCGSCLPAIREALGELAWFPATASARPITRSRELRGMERLIYRVDLQLHGDQPYPVVQPGQHVVLRGETEQGAVERTYTVIAQDVAARRLAVAIRRKPDGRFTPWLLPLWEGAGPRRLEVSVPGGPGLRAGGARPAVFFAGGVGITPAVAMLNALAPGATMHLHYSVNDADDAAFLSRFEARSKDRPGFSHELRETSASGPLRPGDIGRVVARFPGAKFFICGPAGYVETVRRALRKAKVDGGRIHVEEFALGTRAPARSPRFRAYAAGALLSLSPLLLLLPALEPERPHGHPNVGHEELKCAACHVEAAGTLRQVLQAKAKHVLGLRQTGAVLGMQPVSSATCMQCHANPDDRHAPNRFFEPRFAQAREQLAPQLCVSCHREHSAARVTVAPPTYCVNCHQDVKVKDDKISPTHEALIVQKRWETCLQCHDYHGNHHWNAPLRVQDGVTLQALEQYLKKGPSPYGPTIVKATQGGPS
jgi:ferredoxin-NADP reductase/bacterioferritin-associated ferredoxin